MKARGSNAQDFGVKMYRGFITHDPVSLRRNDLTLFCEFDINERFRNIGNWITFGDSVYQTASYNDALSSIL